jgi:hypothetical protein
MGQTITRHPAPFSCTSHGHDGYHYHSPTARMRSSPRAPRPSTYGTHNRSFHRLHSSVTPYSLLLLSVANHVPLSELRYSSLFSSSEPSSSSKWGSMEPRPACQTKRRPLMNHAMHGLISKDAPPTCYPALVYWFNQRRWGKTPQRAACSLGLSDRIKS